MRPAGHAEVITVIALPSVLDPDSGEASQVIDERAIADLPLNGRRYTDLALLPPGVTQDPRGLTSGSNGDLLRRNARLPEQLPGGWRRRQQHFYAQAPLPRTVPV